MKKDSCDTLQTRVSRFIFHYRTTPHTTTGVSPAELLMGRRLRTHLSCLIPDSSQVASRQENQKRYYDKNTKHKKVTEGQTVMVRDFTSSRRKWSLGKIKNSSGPMSFNIEISNGTVIRRHMDHIRPQPELGNEFENDRFRGDYDCPASETVLTDGEHMIPEHNELPQPRRSDRLRYRPKRYQPDT